MQIICLDFETEWSDEYNFRKLSTEAYTRDPRFRPLGCGLRGQGRAEFTSVNGLQSLFEGIDWQDTGVLCHHTQFDGLVLSHHYAIKPAFWFDTLSMARLMIGNHLPLGLDALAKHFGLAAKTVPYEVFKGKSWEQLNQWEQSAVAVGCSHDVDLTWDIFKRLCAMGFPREEFALIDLTIRMFTEPVLEGDIELLAKVWEDEEKNKATQLEALGIDKKLCASTEGFANLLREEGVEPATKTGKRGQIYAFAKTDAFMRELVECDDPRVATLASARLGVKSTITQTRAERLGFMARRGRLCAYYRYAGAHTTRWSGGDHTNFQNFGRSSDLRRAMVAPIGFKLAIVDLSQIECRLLNFLAGQHDVIERFRSGADPYVPIASAFYGREITKADGSERGTGKQAELSCGYGCGPPRFQRTASLGIYGPPVKLDLADASCFVQLYRQTHPGVVAYWRQAESLLPVIASGGATQWGPMLIKDQRIWLPNGAPLIYDTLEYDAQDGWRIKTRAGWQKMYGAKLVENAIQALARVLFSEALARCAVAYKPVLMSHDEAVFLVADRPTQENDLAWITTQFKQEPRWLPGIPLDAEGHLAERYDK